MAWLLRERAQLKGLIDRCKRQIEDLPLRLVQFQTQMDALDAVFPLHAVPVDPRLVVGLQPRRPAILNYGVMSKGILQCLRIADGQPKYTTEIALSVARYAGLVLKQSNKFDLVRRVSKRLNVMVAEGSVQRHHSIEPGDHEEGQWSLADNEAERKAA